MWRKESIRSIAKRIGRSHSSLVREVRRNKSPVKGTYTPRLAHERALKQRKSRGRVERLKNERIRSYVVRHLKKRWSPEQIAGRIRIDLKERVSHEAVYQFIYAQIRNGSVVRGGEDLRAYLRRRRKRRIPPRGTTIPACRKATRPMHRRATGNRGTAVTYRRLGGRHG